MAALVRECRRVSTRTITVVALLLAVLVPLGIGVARSITAGAAGVAPQYGDVFVANASTSTVVQYDHYNAGSGGSPTVLGTVGTGLNRPTGVAVGPNGHVYIADSGNARVLDVAPDGTQTTIGRNWVEPYAVAADIVGNVYVADISAQRVAKISPTGFQTYIARSDTNPGDDFTNPQALAVDQSGNVYIAAARDGGGIVLEVTPTGTKSTLFRSDFIRGLAVDAAGDLYLTTDPYLAVLHPGDSAPTNLYTRPLDGFALESMAIDASGNLYTTTGSGLRQGIQWFATNRNPLAPRTWLDGGNGGPIGIAVFEWPPAFPTDGAVPPDGTVGVPYATRDGIPQDPSGSFGANKVTVASGTLPPGLKLACNAGCFVLAGTPTAAGTYTFTLQSANQQGAILGEPMTITIGKGTATLAVDAPAAATFGDPPAAVTATSNATGAITWSTTGPCAYDAGAVSFSGAGDCVVTATQAADDDYLEATASATIVVAKGTPTQTLSAPSNAAYGDAPVAVSLTSSSTSAVSWSTTGPCAYDAGKVSFTGVGDCVVTADQAADADYVAASTSATIVVAKGDPGLSVTAPSAATFGDAPVAVSATSSSTGDITWSTDGPCAYSSGKVSFSGAGSCIVTADQVADANYLADTSSATIDVAKRAPGLVVTAPSAATFGDAPVAVSASSASSGAITWSTDGPCAYSAGKVSFSGAGDCVVTADQAATTDDLADSASSTIVVAKAAPVLSLTVPASATFGDAPVGVSASSASSGAITWSTDGPCAYSAGKVSFSGAGDCVVTADQAATADYTPATGSKTIVVAKAVPVLSLTVPASATFGDAPVGVSASSASSGAITWSTDGPCAYSAGKVSFSGAGDCVVAADQAATADYTTATGSSTIVVAKAVPTLQVTAPASATFGDAAVAVSASSESSGTITWSTSGPCAYAAGKVSFSGAGDCVVTADQAAASDYAATSASSTIVVAKAAPDLVVTAPSNAAFGDAPVAVSATSTSPATITWSTSGPCTYGAGKVTFTGAGNCVVTADQAATANYLAASVPQTIVVGLGTSGLSVTAPSSATYGDVPVAVSATSASSGAITWWTTGPCAYAAGKVSFSGAGDCVVTADQAATVDYAAATASKTIVVGKATTTLTITAPTSVTFGDAPVDVSATSASTGAISWSTDGPCTYAAGKVTFTGPGACSLTADQATDANHLAATATTTITVDPLPLTLDGLPAEVTVGDQVTLTAGGFHPGEAVTFTFHSVPIDLATVDADALGTASADIVVPDEPGDHTITATGGSSGLEASANTFVKALVTTTTTSTTTTAPPTTTSTTTSTTTTAPPTTTTAPPTTTSTTTTTTTAPPTTTTAPPTTTSTTTSTTSTTTPPTTSSTTSTTSTTTSTTAPPTSSTTSTTTSTIPGSSTSTTGASTSSTSEADGGSTTTSEGGDVASGGADQGSGGQGDVGSGTLARTGSSTGSPVLLGATLVALGAAFVALSRRRLRRAA